MDSEPSAADQARNFLRVREAHKREIAEDYVEMISELSQTQDAVRTGHLAERFGVSHATVTNHIQRLIAEGLVHDRPYQPLVLTEQGAALAHQSRGRHLLIRSFLIAIGVSPETAEADTEGIEHHVSQETLACFTELLKWIEREGSPIS
ncbi:Mn-dependent transcriptional regulator MntR [Candidatus Rhodobacter oscarellae]|uniref:Transcriptional regulator MntR n=2 Tax=Candidatus Rhodobacter oscarellae TaxID=1675527 RepID=A0A0J9E7R0_9RHOB|nr:Mn-dependent transcriptional regulator MntR [Candidatus Rhodobacter lobularis]